MVDQSNTEGRVFIVDHDPNDVIALAAALRNYGYQVDLATTGSQALELVPQAMPDVLLIEVDLPDANGIALCERLRSHPESRNVPVIFLGEASSIQTRVEALEKGGHDFVSRPFDSEEMLARVKRQVTVSRVRAALQESEAKFRSVTESAVDAIISADSRGFIRSWNQAATKLFGFTEAEMLGEPIDHIVPERYQDAHRAGIQRVSEGGPSRVIGSTVEVAAMRKQGDEFPVELSLATWWLDGKQYYTGILRDITERKEAEQKFRSVTESAIDAIVSADCMGVVVGWNKAAEAIFGWTAEELIGVSIETVIPERFRAAHRNGMDRMTRTGESRVIGTTVELAALRKSGEEFPIELSLSTWTVDDKRFYSGIIRDISQRKQAEEQLKQYADQLAEQHEALKKQHEELRRSRQALAKSYQQAQRLFSAMTDGLPGAVLNGKYELTDKIASGGFGVVYQGVQLSLKRKVAIKLLRPPTNEDEDAVFARFRRESVSACRVQHLNAVGIVDADVSDGGFPYIVMEFLEGLTLEQRLQLSPLAMPVAVSFIADVCNVLAAAHQAGVIHRDIKPSNIFLQKVAGSGKLPMVKVLDFGIAKLMDEPGVSKVTRTGFFLGTPKYAAPERLIHAGEPEGTASDIYSMSVVLYEALAGRPPIEPKGILDLESHLRLQAPSLAQLRPDLPEDLCELVASGLERLPSARPSASEFESGLRSILATVTFSADDLQEVDLTEAPDNSTRGTSARSAETVELGHPTDERLIDFVASRLSKSEKEAVAAHVKTCKKCAQRVESLEPGLKPGVDSLTGINPASDVTKKLNREE